MGLPNAKIKFYPNGVNRLSVFNYPRFREVERGEVELPETYDCDSPSRSDSIKRAKDMIFDIAYLNESEWKYFITFTLDRKKIDRYDASVIKKTMIQWLKNQVRRKGLKYLIVPEYHKDKAIHFHGLINDCDFTFVDSGKVDDSGRKIYNVRDWRLGFTTAIQLDEQKVSLCNYMVKYVTKDVQRIFGNFYLAGGHIERVVPFEYIELDYDTLDVPEFEIPNTDIKVKFAVSGVFENE